MNKKEYLNEEQYQENKKKFNKIGTILLIVGIMMLLFGFIMTFGFGKSRLFIFAVIGMAIVGFGIQAKLLSNGREINAYLTQQQMPIAQESIEKLAPSAGVAAKEITKGIKEGLKEEK